VERFFACLRKCPKGSVNITTFNQAVKNFWSRITISLLTAVVSYRRYLWAVFPEVHKVAAIVLDKFLPRVHKIAGSAEQRKSLWDVSGAGQLGEKRRNLNLEAKLHLPS
jgi:hypothetical protein